MKNLSSDFILNRMMALHPKVIDLTLDRVWSLLDSLGNPQNNLPKVIHIAAQVVISKYVIGRFLFAE